jgi:uncharacterized protein involved in type VI secretion and phage assembly
MRDVENDPFANSYFGKNRGVVVDNRDDDRRGRLLVKVPAVLESVEVWAMPCVPYAGEKVGFYMLPKVGSGVWVEFEAGDPSFPIWTGCFWAKDDIDAADAKPEIKFLRTEKFKLRIDDTVGEVSIETKDGSQVKLTAIEIELKSSTVTSRASGGKKTSLSAVGFDVNDGGLEVL